MAEALSEPDEPDQMGLDLRIETPAWRTVTPDLEAFIGGVLAAAARRAGKSGEVSLLLTDDGELHELNKRWRGLDKPTDVLSFPAGPQLPREEGAFLGDVAIAYGVLERDARELGRPLDAHLAHLVTHGFLHLLGYDHIDPAEADVMEALEADILADLGWPDPYQRDREDRNA